MWRKSFSIIFIQLIVSIFVFGTMEDAYKLTFQYINGSIIFKKCEEIRVQRSRIYQKSGNWNLDFSDNEGNVVFRKNMIDPRYSYTDSIDDKGNMEGGRTLHNDVIFSTYVPQNIDISKVQITRTREPFHSGNININTKEIIGDAYINLFPDAKIQSSPALDMVSLEKIVDNGPDENRIVLVILPFKYGRDELGLFNTQVTSMLWRTDSKNIFTFSPFKVFIGLINIYKAEVVNLDFHDLAFSSLYAEGSFYEKVDYELRAFFSDYISTPIDLFCFMEKYPGQKYAGAYSAPPPYGLGAVHMNASHGEHVSATTLVHELGHSPIGGGLA